MWPHGVAGEILIFWWVIIKLVNNFDNYFNQYIMIIIQGVLKSIDTFLMITRQKEVVFTNFFFVKKFVVCHISNLYNLYMYTGCLWKNGPVQLQILSIFLNRHSIYFYSIEELHFYILMWHRNNGKMWYSPLFFLCQSSSGKFSFYRQ